MRKKYEMKTLILYYSYGGNTKRIAEMIQKEIGGPSMLRTSFLRSIRSTSFFCFLHHSKKYRRMQKKSRLGSFFAGVLFSNADRL